MAREDDENAKGTAWRGGYFERFASSWYETRMICGSSCTIRRPGWRVGPEKDMTRMTNSPVDRTSAWFEWLRWPIVVFGGVLYDVWLERSVFKLNVPRIIVTPRRCDVGKTVWCREQFVVSW